MRRQTECADQLARYRAAVPDVANLRAEASARATKFTRGKFNKFTRGGGRFGLMSADDDDAEGFELLSKNEVRGVL